MNFEFLSQLGSALHKRVYAENMTCFACGAEVFGGATFCDGCKRALPFITRFCVRCGRKVKVGGYCLDCKRSIPLVYKARSLFDYQDRAVELIHAFKNGSPFLAQAFVDESAPIFQTNFLDADFITFVPMRKEGLKVRGYNQAELLAKAVGGRMGKTVYPVLEKIKDTPEQKSLTAKERRENLQGAFRVTERALCRDKKILLVDDALTTGSTAETIADLLIGAGADRVYLYTVASVSLEK